MPPSGLMSQVLKARGYAENGAGLCLVAGLPIIIAVIVALVLGVGGVITDIYLDWYYIFIIAVFLLCALLFVTRYVASGAAYGVLSLRDGACEMWQRRLDHFILTGKDEASSSTSSSSDEKNSSSSSSSSNNATTTTPKFLTPLAIVTGANSGVGFETAQTLVQCGFKVIMACRNQKAAEAAKAALVKECQQRIMFRYREAILDEEFKSVPPKNWDKKPQREEENPFLSEEEKKAEEQQKKKMEKNQSQHALPSPRQMSPAEEEADRARRWQGVRRRAIAFLESLPSHVTIVPLDVGNMDSIDAFLATVTEEHFAGVKESLSSASVSVSSSSASSKLWTPVSFSAVSAPTATTASPSTAAPIHCYHDGIRVLLNNAGCYEPVYGKLAPMLGGTVEGLMGVNYVGPTHLTHALLRNIKVGSGGLANATTSRAPSENRANSNKAPRETDDCTATINSDSDSVHAASFRKPLRIINLSSVAHSWALNPVAEDLASFDSIATQNKKKGNMNNKKDATTSVEALCVESDLAITARLTKVLEAVGSFPDATPATNTTLKRYIRNTYGLSKLGAIALTRAISLTPELNDPSANANVSTFSLHPGAVRTQVFRSAPRAVQLVIETVGLLLFKTSEEGAALQTYLCLGVAEDGGDDNVAARAEGNRNSVLPPTDPLTKALLKGCFDPTMKNENQKRNHHDDNDGDEKGGTVDAGRSLFSGSAAPRNPSPMPSGYYYTDAGPVGYNTSSNEERTAAGGGGRSLYCDNDVALALASHEALCDQSMVAMHRWAMEKIRHHHQK